MVAALLGLAAYGLSLQDHLSQSGWDDPGSESVAAAKLADTTFGRDTQGDVLAMYKAPDGKTVDDPDFQAQVSESLTRVVEEHPDKILKANGGFFEVGDAPKLAAFASPDKQYGIESIAIAGDNDTEVTQNFRDVKDAFYADGLDVQLAGLQPVAGALNDTMAEDISRMEILAIPAVGILLFFVFGGVVAAALPLVIGGLTVVGANGIVRLFTNFTEVNSFVAPVVSLVGLGLAIDYGLFIVSRFREEIADGYDTPAAVRRAVMTAGRTVVFSATMIVASLGGLLLFPQGFLKSVAYGAIATVGLAALSSITILPALLGILGKRVDALSFDRVRQTKSTEEIESGGWARMTQWVMKNPLKVTIPIVIGLLLLITPLTGIKFGGINETYLPPDSDTRVAQEQFDEMFPGMRTEPVKLVVSNADNKELNQVIREASGAPGLVERFSPEGTSKDGIIVLKAGLTDRNESDSTIEYLRSMDTPDDVEVLVGGTPAIEHDSIAALLERLPMMVVFVVGLTTILMFLTFGSLVLPIKAALMSALGLGSTLGILTWVFVDGHGASLLNFTPGPIMSPVLVLIIAIVYGLSTDYEVFLLSRMVEARAQGASTTEAVRVGTAHTGRIITAAALILIVVTGAFGFSELVMMKYIAYGMISALIIDATLIRMGLVPAVMKLLGDDCWWAPRWMKRIQQRIGLAEPILDSELLPADVPELTPVAAPPGPGAAAPARRNEPLTEPIPLAATTGGSKQAQEARRRATRADTEARRSATGRPARAPEERAQFDEAPAEPAVPHSSGPHPSGPQSGGPQSGGPQPPVPNETASPAGPPTESRPIESWLADLRSTTGHRGTSGGPHTDSTPRPVRRGTNGTSPNGAGHNGTTPHAPGPRNGSVGPTNGGVPNGSVPNGSVPNGADVARPPLPRREATAAPERRVDAPRPEPQRPEPQRPEPQRPEPVRPDAQHPEPSWPGHDEQPSARQEPADEPRRRRRRAAEPEDDDPTGRHASNPNAVSVSELLARQKRQR
nr:MMPL family transporter [Rhodococcus sp. HNM0569]